MNDLYDDVKRKSMMRLEYENLMNCEAIASPSSKFYQKPLEYALWKYAYYVCHKCKKVSWLIVVMKLMGLLMFDILCNYSHIVEVKPTVLSRFQPAMITIPPSWSVHRAPMWAEQSRLGGK